MTLPKSMSDSLIKKLNEACRVFKGACDRGCDGLGWCEACWLFAGAEKKDGGEDDGD